MLEKIIKIKGSTKGPTSIILAGVHGNEKCGILALKKIIPSLKIERGQVFFGYGNPQAIKKNIRFIDSNLNRIFKDGDLLSTADKHSYEYKRAQYLKKYLDRADALLDIHASHTPNSIPFIVCEKNAKEIVKYLPVDLIVSGFDKIQPGGTDYYMNKIGKISVCVECGYFEDSKSTQIAEKIIYAFLKARGHIINNNTPRKQSHIKISSIYTTKTNAFKLTKQFKDFEKITKGQLIGIDGKKEVLTKQTGVILFARNRNQAGEEAFLLGKNKDSLA
jgi:succinylglutamate desuccinylase